MGVVELSEEPGGSDDVSAGGKGSLAGAGESDGVKVGVRDAGSLGETGESGKNAS